jgi:hypothetical protein
MSSAVSNIIPNPLSHKHDGSPRSISTLSSSPACGSNFSPNQANFSQPNCGVGATTSNTNSNGYQVYGVSPTEGSTATGICSGNNGPMSNVENSLTGNIDNSMKMKENDFYSSEDPLIQMSTNLSNLSVPSTPIIGKESFDEDEEEDGSRYNSPMQQHSMYPMQQQVSPFDQITSVRKQYYPIGDRTIIGRLPYAFNRPMLPFPYPLPEGVSQAALNRSPAYHPVIQMGMRFNFPPPHMGMMHPGMMPLQIPHPNPPPPPLPQPTKPKSRSRKQNNNNNNNQQQQQHQHHHQPPQMSMMAQPQMIRPPMDMMRASSSVMGPPDMALHQNMKINGSLRPPAKRHQGIKVVDSGVCQSCTGHINPNDRGVLCTALNQGCMKTFHARCETITDEALHVLVSNENIEWVCRLCTTKQLIWTVDS